MRDDVRQFAELMSEVMDEKQGECREPDSFLKAMGQVQWQMQKFEQVPFPRGKDAQRILVHVANWCMIAGRKLREEEAAAAVASERDRQIRATVGHVEALKVIAAAEKVMAKRAGA